MTWFSRLRCSIAGHRPGPGTAWNHGYCFGHCLRCGEPIMRAVFGSWRAPPAGYRIVWPAHRRRAAAGATGTTPPQPAARGEWDFMAEPAAAPPRPRTASRDAVDFSEFMADDAADEPPSPPPLPRRQVS